MNNNNIIIGFFIFFCTFNLQGQQDENPNETSNGKSLNLEYLSYLIDDIYVTAGINRGGIMFSNYFRDLRDDNGINFGVESYFPLQDKMFLNFGVNYLQTQFGHVSSLVEEDEKVVFKNHILEMPLYGSFELPIMRSFDFRFLLGIHLNYRLMTESDREYPSVVTELGPYKDGGNFHYPASEEMRRFNGGMYFGLSWERSNVYFRLRSSSGFNNLHRNEQGMLHSFHIDLGVFPFRLVKNITGK